MTTVIAFSRHNRDFKIQRRDGDKNVAEKVNLRSFSLYRNYSYKLTLSNVGEPYPSTVREIKFRLCLFTSSVKREIRHVHVVVVLKRAEKCTKKHGARAKLLFC